MVLSKGGNTQRLTSLIPIVRNSPYFYHSGCRLKIWMCPSIIRPYSGNQMKIFIFYSLNVWQHFEPPYISINSNTEMPDSVYFVEYLSDSSTNKDNFLFYPYHTITTSLNKSYFFSCVVEQFHINVSFFNICMSQVCVGKCGWKRL